MEAQTYHIEQSSKASHKILGGIILAIFIAKIVAAGCFSSAYLQQIFLPFVSAFISDHRDPWQYFASSNPDIAFPYPPLMLYLLTPFAGLLKLFSIQSAFWTNILFKTPSFIADLVIFYALCYVRPQAKLLFTLVYFASPIVFFSTYIQGQLDLIPTAILFVSIILLMRAKIIPALLAFTAALLCKSTSVVALPFILIFLYRRHNWQTALYFLAATIGLYLIASLPFILHESYIQTVFYNPQQGFIFNSGYAIGNLLLFPVILLTLAIISHFFLYKKINNDLLLSYLSLAFSLLLIFAYPVPSWFVWIMPYLSMFLVTARKERSECLTLYAVFCAVYMVFFLFFYQYPLKPDMPNLLFLGNPVSLYAGSEHARSLIFTILAGMLAVQVYLNYRYSIRSNAIYKSKGHATVIGISGDSGSGKSIFLNDIHTLLGYDKATHLEGDGEHRWERGHENWKNHTHLDPKANLLHQQAEILEKLKQGLKIYRREYDHTSGTFTSAKLVRTNDYVIIAGLHPFYLPKARKLVDIKIFLDTDEQLRNHWKIQRDQVKRGQTKETILASLEQRAPDRNKFIVPQKTFADLCFRYTPSATTDNSASDSEPQLELQVSLSANVNLDAIYHSFSNCQNLSFHYDYSQDLQTQEIAFTGDISSDEIKQITQQHITNIDELIGREAIWQSGMRGLRQLLTLVVISHHLKEMMS